MWGLITQCSRTRGEKMQGCFADTTAIALIIINTNIIIIIMIFIIIIIIIIIPSDVYFQTR